MKYSTSNEPDDKDKFDEVLKKFDEHCLSKKNETYERYVYMYEICLVSNSLVSRLIIISPISK